VQRLALARVYKDSDAIKHSDRSALYAFEVEHGDESRDQWVLVEARMYNQQPHTRSSSLSFSIFQPVCLAWPVTCRPAMCFTPVLCIVQEALALPVVFSTPVAGTTANHIHAAIALALVYVCVTLVRPHHCGWVRCP
jgi:hypothetical protein